MTRQVWSSLRPSEGNEKPLPRALKQEENPRQVTFAQRRDPLSRRELLYLLASLPPSLKTEESSLRLLVNKTELPSLRFPHVSSLPHSRQEENCLHTRTPSQNNRQVPQLHEKEEGCVYRSVGKKRHPFSLGKGNKRAPISSSSSEDRRELPLKKKGWSSADLQKEKSGPPSQAFKHKKIDAPLRDPQQEESLLQVTLGKRIKLLSRRELHYPLVSHLSCPPPDFNNIA